LIVLLIIRAAIVESNIVPNADTLGTNETYAAEQLALYWERREGAYTQTHNGGNTVAFLPLQNLTADYQTIIGQSTSHSKAFSSLGDGHGEIDPVTLGYLAQREIILRRYASTTSSVMEYAWSTSSKLLITNVKPLSRGSILINGTEPLTPPVVDYGAFNDPMDIEILIAGVRKIRELMATPAMQGLGPIELMPGMNVTTDEQIAEVLRAQTVPTYSHLCGTCAMMGREIGGVVGADLRVHDTVGLSVVDASIMPMIPATHTSSTVYAVAEKVSPL
jgi:choline dehydrogenase-like flavoprotein